MNAHRAHKLTRPVLRWHGGKWKLAPWIISQFPAHRVYVEPFGGAASVLLRKPRAFAEIWNDLDGELVNLFRCLRDEVKAARLIEALRLTPFARAEFAEAYEATADDIERARRMIIRSFMGYGAAGALGNATGFRANANASGAHNTAAEWAGYPDALGAIIDRFRNVVVESCDAIDLMRRSDRADTLHYVDPPYLPETRNPGNPYDTKHRYRHELTADDHERLLAELRQLEGFVILSGYPSELYDRALAGWHRVERAALADGARQRTEVLWINPRAWAAAQPPLFSSEGFSQ